jgi:hypothetical protein
VSKQFLEGNPEKMGSTEGSTSPNHMQATIQDGQDAGEMLLDIEARIGELLPSSEEMSKKRAAQYKGRPVTEQTGLRQLPDCITNRQDHQARTIKDNPTWSPRSRPRRGKTMTSPQRRRL